MNCLFDPLHTFPRAGAWLKTDQRLEMREKVELDRALVATTDFHSGERNYMDDYLKAFRSICLRVSGCQEGGFGSAGSGIPGCGTSGWILGNRP